MEIKSFTAGDIVFEEGQAGEVAYLVESGTIEVFVTKGKDRNVIGEVRETGLFGEMALISNLPRMASAVAKTDAKCVVIPRKVLNSLFSKSDPLLNALMFNLIGHIRSLNKKLNPEVFKKNDVEFFFKAGEGEDYKLKN